MAAARGLPIPPADQTPPEELVPRPLSSSASPSNSSQNLANLMVPMGGRTLSQASDRSASNVGSALPSPTTAAAPNKGLTSSPFKPRAKALAAALSVSSRNGSSTEIAPREINLPHDPFVNGQPLEVFLYKDGSECPICFLYYPPYLNHTRCCDQAICSECFVQIKRPDPHFPEGHGDQDNPNASPEETSGLLVSEPAQCPYCQQPDFGVTYEAPPFRRGLTHAFSTAAVGSMNAAMSSSSSINSNLSPTSPSAGASRRRTQSLSVNAPNVITTDRVRPDWATKLSAQRNHQARRAAAATALHTAAFLMGDTSTRPFSRIGRFSRRNTGGNSGSNNNNNAGDSSPGGAQASHSGSGTPAGPEPGPRSSSGRGLLAGPASDRRSHMENLENMMLAEAIRLSLAAEEERKRKVEKDDRKEAKKKEKEERKAAKAAAKGQPYTGSGQSSASGSTLSLPGLSAIGRRRGNSAASNLRVEATTANAMASSGSSSIVSGSSVPTINPTDKGKGVDRGPAQTAPETEVGSTNVDSLHPTAVSTSSPTPAPTSTPRPIPSPHQHAPSHLRQMSSVSSASSTPPDSQSGSYQNPLHLQDPHASGLSLGGQSDNSEDGEAGRSADNERDPSQSTEPMFNFSSLAEMVGVEMEGIHAGRRLSQIGERRSEEAEQDEIMPHAEADKRSSMYEASNEHVEDASKSGEDMSKSVATLTQDSFNAHEDEGPPAHSMTPPELMVTPETPLPQEDGEEDSKQLGFQGTQTVAVPVTR